MLFRKKASTGRHRGPSEKELKRKDLDHEDAPAWARSESEGPTARSPRDTVGEEMVPHGATLPSLPVGETHVEVVLPEDEIAKKAQLFLRGTQLSEGETHLVLDMLKQRYALLEKLAGMNRRIERLVKDSQKSELALDEIKIKSHLRDLESEEDESDLIRESWDMDPTYAVHRESLDRSVRLLVRMEQSKSSLSSEYPPLMEQLVSLLPLEVNKALYDELCALIAVDIEAFCEEYDHMAINGEYLDHSSESLEAIHDFLRELEGEGTHVEAKPGDSLFHLE